MNHKTKKIEKMIVRERLLERREVLYLVILLAFTLLSMHQVNDIRIGTQFRPYPFIVWNLFLAWVPIAFQLIFAHAYERPKSGGRTLVLAGAGAGWFFFYPNAPYLVTDLLHVFANYPVDPDTYFWRELPFWNHLFSLLLAALIGLVLGCYSLWSVHKLVRRSYGRVIGWAFALSVLALGSLGVYFGRFLRLNSWDLVTSPSYLWSEITTALAPSRLHFVFSFCEGMFLLMLFAYTGFSLLLKRGQGEEGRNGSEIRKEDK
ncbi:DUF1361 domain-containing protein [Gorillibacterium timonense]|uniref:DUF1361 domain-containing protein n=1 Tax=Gorillibacterium timonense TaxID=1689269 RepID=UPI00071D65EC|nr:DUF1361 domain-containing protein [Gorillibacterium timonense]